MYYDQQHMILQKGDFESIEVLQFVAWKYGVTQVYFRYAKDDPSCFGIGWCRDRDLPVELVGC